MYALPRVEELFASLAEGETFTKLDLSHEYQQILLSEESKQYVTINTSRGASTVSTDFLLVFRQHSQYSNAQWRTSSKGSRRWLST